MTKPIIWKDPKTLKLQHDGKDALKKKILIVLGTIATISASIFVIDLGVTKLLSLIAGV